MSSLIEVLNNSFVVLKKEPKLFFPKIFLALIWGFLLLYYASLLVQVQAITLIESVELQAVMLEEVFSQLFFLLFLFFVFFVLDSVINSAYPLMIKDFLDKKSFSVFNSIKFVLKNFFKIVLPVMLASVIAVAVLIPFIFVFAFFFLQKNFFLMLIFGLIILLIGFITVVFFYFIYPIASIEKKGLISVIDSVKKSRKNLKEASFGSFILLILSLVSAFIVSLAETQAVSIIALIIFILLRVLTAVLATYSMVLNPLLYFKK